MYVADIIPELSQLSDEVAEQACRDADAVKTIIHNLQVRFYLIFPN